MKNNYSKLTLCLAAFCLTIGVLASCGEGDTTATSSASGTTSEATTIGSTTEPVTEPDPTADEPAYVFTVVCGDTNLPVSGVMVQICKGEDFCLLPVTTDAEGKANYVLTGSNSYDEYDVHIIGGIPEGYTFDNTAVKTDAETHSYTLTLVKTGTDSSSESGATTTAPTVTTTIPGGSTPVTSQDPSTGSDPVTTTTVAPEKTTNPVTTTVPSGGNDPVTHQHIYVNEVCTICGATKTYDFSVRVIYDYDCTDADGKAHTQGEGIPGVQMVITNDEGTKLIAMGSTNENGIFSFNAPKYTVYDAGEAVSGYSIQLTGGIPDGFMKDPKLVFQAESLSCIVGLYPKPTSGDREAFSPEKVESGKTIKIYLEEERFDDSDDPLFATPQDDSLYYYAFTPDDPGDVGVYRVTITNVNGASSVYIGNYPCSGAGYVQHDPYDDCFATGKEPSFIFLIEEQYLKDGAGEWAFNNKWLFGISASSYPVSMELKIEKIRDIVVGEDVPIYDKQVLEITANAPTAVSVTGSTAGKTLDYIEYSNTTELYRDSNGYYHVGSVNGPLAMVILNKETRMLGGEEGITFCTVNQCSGVQMLSASTYDENTNTITIYYFEQMLKSYGELCNEDGAYPVNDQLLSFLKMWTLQKCSMVPSGLDEEHGYLYGISYYH
ncbi:MAG: hypothetical protein ACI3YK_06715 [Eubacteriales bacterium]